MFPFEISLTSEIRSSYCSSGDWSGNNLGSVMYSMGRRQWIRRSYPVNVSIWATYGRELDLIIVLLIDSSQGGNSISMKLLGKIFFIFFACGLSLGTLKLLISDSKTGLLHSLNLLREAPIAMASGRLLFEPASCKDEGGCSTLPSFYFSSSAITSLTKFFISSVDARLSALVPQFLWA